MPIKAQLYSADAADQEPELSTLRLEGLTERQLLWLDLDSPTREEVGQVAQLIGCQPAQLRVAPGERELRPTLVNYGEHFRITVEAVALESAKQALQHTPLTLLAGRNVVVTVHEAGGEFFDVLRGREKGDSSIGELSAESFTASLLDWVLDTYFQALESLVRDIDRVEVAILGRKMPPQFLGTLVSARKRISELRRLLKSHRDVFYGLARPDFMATENDEARPHFQALNQHFERAQDELDGTRDMVIGSFELLSTRAAQKTNDTMGALTFATVLMGTLALIAGILGMNFQLGIYEQGWVGFACALGAMALVSVASIIVGIRRGWI